MPIRRLAPLRIPLLTDLPIVGPIFFHYDLMVYLALALCALIAWMFSRTRLGLRLRAVGEAPDVAYALGQPVTRIRTLAVVFGGAMSGIAGAYLSTAVTPMWVEGMSAGRGWIALALVVFGSWQPWRVLAGALLFGGVTVLQLYAQGFGFGVPSELWSMLPCLATILVLVIIGRDAHSALRHKPVALGRSWAGGDRL